MWKEQDLWSKAKKTNHRYHWMSVQKIERIEGFWSKFANVILIRQKLLTHAAFHGNSIRELISIDLEDLENYDLPFPKLNRKGVEDMDCSEHIFTKKCVGGSPFPESSQMGNGLKLINKDCWRRWYCLDKSKNWNWVLDHRNENYRTLFFKFHVDWSPWIFKFKRYRPLESFSRSNRASAVGFIDIITNLIQFTELYCPS